MTGRTWLRNAVDVALNGAIDQTATSIVVDDASLLPDDTPFYIVIDPFNDTGREYIRVGTINKGTNTLSDLDRNLEGTQSLVHADGATVRLSWQSQHLDDAWEDQVGITSRGRWRGTWVESATYIKNDMVLDGSYLAIANKETTEPAAPVPQGDSDFLLPDAPTWVPQSHVGAVLNGVRVVPPADTLWAASRVRFWIPNISGDVEYTVWVEDNLTGALNQIVTVRGDVLGAPGWFSYTIAEASFRDGDDFTVWLLTQNRAASTTFNHPWVRAADSNQDLDPGLGDWNTNTQLNKLRINNTDDDGVSRVGELGNVLPGATIRPADEADLNAYYDFQVLENLGDQGGWFLFLVSLNDVGVSGQPTLLARQQLYFDIPTAAATDYVQLTDYWVPFPNVSGVLNLGAGDVANENAYGLDVEIQQFIVSDDWDLMSTTGSAGGGSGVPGLTEPQADVLYLRLDAANSPVTGKPTFGAGLVLGANLEAGGFRLTGLAVPPTADAEAAAKKYVDDQDTAHDVAPDPHPQYLTPTEGDGTYLKLDASNGPVTAPLVIQGTLDIFDTLNILQDAASQGNLRYKGQNRISFQNNNLRTRFFGSDNTILGHMYDNKTIDLPGSMLGAWYFTAAVNLLASGNTIVFTTDINVAALFPGGAADVPELLVVTDGFIRQNNQGAAAHQARTEVAGTSRNYGYAVGSVNAASARSSAPMPNNVKVAAGAAAVTVAVSARSFGTDISGTMDLHVRIYAAPVGGNI